MSRESNGPSLVLILGCLFGSMATAVLAGLWIRFTLDVIPTWSAVQWIGSHLPQSLKMAGTLMGLMAAAVVAAGLMILGFCICPGILMHWDDDEDGNPKFSHYQG